MDTNAAVVVIGVVVTLALLIVAYLLRPQKKKDVEVNRQRPQANRAQAGAPRRAQMMRNRGARLRANAAQQARDSDEDNGAAGDEEGETADAMDAKIGAKKRAKLEAKAEKKAQREAEEQSRQDRKKREQQADDERRRAEEKERAEERRREEDEKKAREEKERREHEEYLRMKEAFSVEEEGYEEGDEGGEGRNALQEFVAYVKTQKVVLIEDLAAHFKLKTQAAIDRIRDLQNDNVLTGVIDDRGKFIYVSQEEMTAVAKFIRQRGRVSIQELAENSNKLINLTPTINA